MALSIGSLSLVQLCFLGGLNTFIAVGLKGFQHLNVIGFHYKLTAITAMAMAMFDVISIGFIVHLGFAMVLPAGIGAAAGMMLSMWIHQKFIPRDHALGQK